MSLPSTIIRSVARVAVRQGVSGKAALAIMKATGREVAREAFLGQFQEIKQAARLRNKLKFTRNDRAISSHNHIKSNFYTGKKYTYRVEVKGLDKRTGEAFKTEINVSSHRRIKRRTIEGKARQAFDESFAKDTPENYVSGLAGASRKEVGVERVMVREAYKRNL